VLKAVQDLAAAPESKGRRLTLEEEVAGAGADQDAELVEIANALLEALGIEPGQSPTVTRIGDYNGAATNRSTASVNVSVPSSDKR
jgi:hypothetical protein